ncbi:hypothetical protein B0H14DRAFT_3437675 [Mycena olivaceomarginata]|nr:hypothetical protein B0H14DRAFT_3437675 [Mycena olivaceomarginata]
MSLTSSDFTPVPVRVFYPRNRVIKTFPPSYLLPQAIPQHNCLQINDDICSFEERADMPPADTAWCDGAVRFSPALLSPFPFSLFLDCFSLAQYRAFLPAYAGLTQHAPVPTPLPFIVFTPFVLRPAPPMSADIVVRYASSAPARLPLSTTCVYVHRQRSPLPTAAAAFALAHIPRQQAAPTPTLATLHHINAHCGLRCRPHPRELSAPMPTMYARTRRGAQVVEAGMKGGRDTAARGVFGTRRIT